MPMKRCSLYQRSQRLRRHRRHCDGSSVYYRAEPGIDVNIEMRDGSLQLVPHGGAAYSLHAPAVLEPTDNEAEWLVHGGRARLEKSLSLILTMIIG